MAWFKRNRDEGPTARDDALGEVAPEPTTEPGLEAESSPAPPPTVEPVEAPAWTTAAPMPRATPSIQRVLGNVDARANTTLGRPTPLSLAPLGHAVSTEAPAGIISTLAVADSSHGPTADDQAPLEYVQRAPAGSAPPRPSAPEQLLVPSFQPGRLPTLAMSAPVVQRTAAARPSLTTAPDPGPPLVLPVGEVISREASPPLPAVAPVPPEAPLLSGPLASVPGPPMAVAADVDQAEAAELPLAPVSRQADHTGSVEAQQPRSEGATQAIQRAELDLPTSPAPPVPPSPVPAGAPLLADSPLSPAAALTPIVPPEASHAGPPAEVGVGGDALKDEPDLPLAPVQRHADHPGHIDGDEAPEVQRAAVAASAPSPAESTATAPLVGDSTPLVAESAPLGGDPVPPVGDSSVPVDDSLPLVGGSAPLVGESAPLGGGPVSPVGGSAPLVGDSAPLATSPTAIAPAPGMPVPEVLGPTPAPDLPLPGATVQRSAVARRPAGLGPPISAVPAGAVQPGTIPTISDPVVAPLIGSEPLLPAATRPLSAVQREPADNGEGQAATTPTVAQDGEPSLDLAQRAPADAGRPGDPAPLAADHHVTETAPLVGETPLGLGVGASMPVDGPGLAPTTGMSSVAGGDSPGVGSEAAGAGPALSPQLDLVQRAAFAGASASASSSPSPSSSSSASTPAVASAPLPPLVVAPLLGGRPFSTQVQRMADRADRSDHAGSAPAGLVDRTSPEALSPAPGRLYQPLASIGIWNGAPPPDLTGPAIEAPPSHVAAAVQRAIGTDVSSVRIRRDTGLTAQRLSARAFTHEGEVHIPAAVGSLESGEGASLASHELVHAGQQSVLGSSRPHEHTAEGQALEAQARSAEHASLAGIELPGMPLVPSPPPSVQRSPAEGAGAAPFSPQQLSRLLDLADRPSGGGASIQRESLEQAAPAPAQNAEAPAAAPGPPGEHPKTPQELEELATKLFPTLRNLFRSELLGFRRRSGTSADRPLS